MGLHEKALECFCIDLNHINNADDFKASYLYQKGLTLFYLNRYLEAIDQFDKSLSINIHQNGLSHNMKALSLMEIGDLDSALFFINQAINNNSQNSAIRFNKALEAFEQSIIYNPEQFQSFNQIGVLLFKQKKYEDALKYFQDGLHRKPQSSTFYGNLAITLTKILQYENALKYIENAITLEPNNHKLINQKGLLLAQMGRRKEAIKFFQQNISQYPDNPIYYINRGKIINQIFQDIFWRNTKKNKKLSTLIKMKMQQLTINLVLNQLIWNLINNKKSKISILCLSLIIILELHYLKQRNMMKQLQNSITHLNWMQLQFNLTQ
ncbi:unnamed protein product [Paramecium sonneborni]|uniref:Tetratricopeptide repeat protein n=1 Tax=Paramecium sonneborni TaxID=65129 RepID=A0A8S1RAN4_9CILI|nr:unnamed protein product [Paramecium sonneborni]